MIARLTRREALETRTSLKCVQTVHMGDDEGASEACCDGGDVLFTGQGMLITCVSFLLAAGGAEGMCCIEGDVLVNRKGIVSMLKA